MAIIVNGERIEDETIHDEAERMRPEYEKAFADEAPAAREAKLQEWARDNAVERVLIEQAARADTDPLPDDAIQQTLEAARENAGESKSEDELRAEVDLHLRVSRLMDGVVEGVPQPSEEAVAAFYEEHKKEFMAPERIHAAHIVMHVDANTPPEVAEAKLREARKKLEAGADFGEVADTLSDCQDAGGDLGWFPRGHMVEEFENTVWKMKPGETSDIFATRFGFHIVRMIERKAAAPYTLDEIEDHVREHLTAQMRDQTIETFLDGLREKAAVEEV
ncbi:MAG TPA: peptidylprolyl isomerase [Phycisphaerae bacterium]|nr:peptidylprolyl isomerase [Phycisphaerae bacterium]